MIQYRLSINEQNALQAVESAVNLGAKWLQLDIADDIPIATEYTFFPAQYTRN